MIPISLKEVVEEEEIVFPNHVLLAHTELKNGTFDPSNSLARNESTVIVPRTWLVPRQVLPSHIQNSAIYKTRFYTKNTTFAKLH